MRTHSLFWHQVSLQEQRLLGFVGGGPEVPEPAQAEIAEREPETLAPIADAETAEVWANNLKVYVTARREDAKVVGQEQEKNMAQFEEKKAEVSTPKTENQEQEEKAEIAAAIQELPEGLQEPIAHVLEGMNVDEIAELRTLIEKIMKLNMPIRAALGSFVGPKGDVVIPAGAEKNPQTAEAAKFLGRLSEPERAMYAKVVRGSFEFMTNSRSGKEALSPQEKVTSQIATWKRAFDKGDQNGMDMAEGHLMMTGVDLENENTDLRSGKVVMLPENERGLNALMGLIKVLFAFLEKFEKMFSKKKAEVTDAKPKDQVPASALSPEERDQEMKARKQQLTDAGKTETDLKKEIANVEKKEELPGSDGEELGLEKRKLNRRLKELQASMETLQTRHDELTDAQLAAKPSEGQKSETKPETAEVSAEPERESPDTLASYSKPDIRVVNKFNAWKASGITELLQEEEPVLSWLGNLSQILSSSPLLKLGAQIGITAGEALNQTIIGYGKDLLTTILNETTLKVIRRKDGNDYYAALDLQAINKKISEIASLIPGVSGESADDSFSSFAKNIADRLGQTNLRYHISADATTLMIQLPDSFVKKICLKN